MIKKDLNKQKASIMVFAAVSVATMLILASISFYVLQRATAKEQWGSVWNLVGLAGLKEYFKVSCEDPQLTGSACHDAKMAGALLRMQDIAHKNSHLISNLNVIEVDGTEPEDNFLEITPGRYYYKQIDNQDYCEGESYPCFVQYDAGNSDQLANAFRLRGKVKHGRFTKFIFSSFSGGSGSIDLEIKRTIAAVPLAVAIVVDMSLSVQTANHSYIKNPTASDPKNSYYSFEYGYGAGYGHGEAPPEISSVETKATWDALGAERPVGVTEPWNYHYKDDYRPINHLNNSVDDYYFYSQNTAHPDPAQFPDENPYNNKESYYLVDAHRDPNSGYMGPEPYKSIFKGARKALELVEERNVSGDSVTFVGFDSVTPWRYIINRTTDFSYLKMVLDGDKIEENIHPGYPNTNPMNLPPKMKNDAQPLPLWLRLGLFPAPGKWTDTIKGLTVAVNQLNTGMGDIPSVKAIMLFSDGLVTCSSSLQNGTIPDKGTIGVRCQDWYEYYEQGMKELNLYVHDNMAKTGTALHTFLVGNTAHYLKLRKGKYSPPTGNPSVDNACLTDAEARALNVNYVKGQTFADENAAEYAYDHKNETPFYQVAYDSFLLTKMTGGRWGALLPVSSDCEQNGGRAGGDELYCSDSNDKQRVVNDPKCRSIEDQVGDYIKDVILESITFAVVE